MSNNEVIRETVARAIAVIGKRPSSGQGTEISRIDVAPDGCCTVTDGDQTLTVDLSEDYGGRGSAACPGVLLRASLGACLAQGYIIQAALHGVPINSLSIELQGDYDMRGNLGIDKTIPRSFLCMRYIVTIDSPAPRAAVEQVIDRSDDLDWVRDVFARAIPMEREIKLTHSRAAE